MREIKFRGKRIDNGEWVYGNLVKYPKTENWVPQSEIWFFDDEGGGEHYYIVNPTTVGQFTGLKDKSGQEIYEGDICKYWMDSVWKYGYVLWDQGGFALKVFRMEEKIVDVVFKFQAFIPVPDDGEIMTDQFEVVGNIYDNPELLKEWMKDGN